MEQMDEYFFVGVVVKKQECESITLYDIVLYDGTKLNGVNLDLIVDSGMGCRMEVKS